MQDQDFSEPLCPPLCDGDCDLGLARLMGVLEIMDVKGLAHHRYTKSATVALLFMPIPLMSSPVCSLTCVCLVYLPAVQGE